MSFSTSCFYRQSTRRTAIAVTVDMVSLYWKSERGADKPYSVSPKISTATKFHLSVTGAVSLSVAGAPSGISGG